MAKDLTVKALESLKPGAARREVPDGHTRGLFYVLQPSGAASWAYRYRFAGKPKKLTIGTYPAIDIKAARELASEAAKAVARGDDPAATKQSAKIAARQAANETRELVENVVDTFIERHAKPNTRDWRETQRLLTKEVVSRWKGRRLGGIGRADVHDLLDGIVDRGAPVGANRAYAQLRKMCGWAVERGIIEHSPCDGVRAPSAEKSRDRVLSDEELHQVWRACDAVAWPFGPLVKLLMLTGARRNEVAEMEWSEIDLAAKVWTLPASRSKNRRAHAVPLSPQAIEILESLPRIGDGKGFVFSTTGKTAVSGFSRAKACIDKALASANGGAALAPWTLHDIRRGVATGMGKLNVSLPVIERCLNHVSGSFAGIVSVYQHRDFSGEMRAALEAWARALDAIVTGKPAIGNVVELAKARA